MRMRLWRGSLVPPSLQRPIELSACRLLVLALALTTTAFIAPENFAQAHSTQPSAIQKLEFDVDSVRPSKGSNPSSNVPLGPGNVYSASNGIFSARNFTLLTYLEFAYKLTDYQKDAVESAAPDWVTTDKFSIEARTDDRAVTKDQLRLMMRSLLQQRFKLAAHYEMRQARVFTLVPVTPGRTGPKLQPHPASTTCSDPFPKPKEPDIKPAVEPLQAVKGGFPAVCNGILGLPASAQDRYSFGGANVSMSLIASSLSSWGNLGRPVVDRTGLSGTYDFVMDYTPDPRPSYATIDSGGPGFQEALKQQLGLKLESERAPVEFLALDHVEHPDEN